MRSIWAPASAPRDWRWLSRVGGLTVTLVEIDPALAALAAGNARRNGLADRVRALALDVTKPETFAAAGLAPQSADHVLTNPPFNDLSHASPDAGRRLAHAATPDTLPRWVSAAAHLLKPGGVLTLIWRADGLVRWWRRLRRHSAAPLSCRSVRAPAQRRFA